jgi:hypothetical protein
MEVSMAGENYRNLQGGTAAVGSVELCDRPFQTDGDSSYDYFLVGPILEELGPKITELVVHVLVEEKSTNFVYKIRNQISFDGQTRVVGDDIIAEQSASGYYIGTAYTTRPKFGRYMRFEFCANDSGAPERAFIKVMLYWKYAT